MATRVLITGGAGFIGSHLAERLLHSSYQVTVLDDLSTGQREHLDLLSLYKGFDYAIEDVRNEMVLDRLVNMADVVIHLAAAVGVSLIVDHPIDTIEINVKGTEAVLRMATRYRKKVLIASTSEVYGKNEKVPFSEDDDRTLGATTKTRWGYAASKELDEFLALAYYAELGLPVVVFRLFNTVGPRQIGQYGMVLPRFVQWALRNEPIQVYGDGTQQRCFGNVLDVVDAIHRLMETPTAVGQVFNIGNNEEISIAQLAERVIRMTDSKSEIVFVPYETAYSPGFEDMSRRIPDIRKIKAYTGWEPRIGLDETIRQIVSYYNERSS